MSRSSLRRRDAKAAARTTPATTQAPPSPLVATIASLQRTSGNVAVSRLLKERRQPSNFPMLQRSIGCHPIAGGAPQFQIDDLRPNLIGAAALMVLGADQDRAHIIAFEVMQNDLANILNSMLTARGTPAFATHEQQLINLCDALFVTHNAERMAMAADRTNLLNAMKALPAGLATQAAMHQLTDLSGALLTDLNSCADNLRLGHSGANSSIGYSIDAEFLPGTVGYAGPVQTVHAPALAPAPPSPSAVILPPLPGGPGSLPTVNIDLTECVRLVPQDERQVYAYQTHSTLPLSFVISGTNGGAQFHSVIGPPGGPPGVAGPGPTKRGQHMSSTRMPSSVREPPKLPYPVLVMGGPNSAPLLFH